MKLTVSSQLNMFSPNGHGAFGLLKNTHKTVHLLWGQMATYRGGKEMLRKPLRNPPPPPLPPPHPATALTFLCAQRNHPKPSSENMQGQLICVRLCDPMGCSTPGFPVHHQFPEFTQTPRVGDAIQPSHPLSSLSPPAFNLSQHKGLFK